MLRYHIHGPTRVVSLEPAGYASRPIRGFLPKLFRLQSNSPRRHDVLNDHPSGSLRRSAVQNIISLTATRV
jgi:hypothetical protein